MADLHLDELVTRLEGLAPAFGRAEKDILAICTRARSEDFRGVLQNTRLVVETLLRAIYAKNKQTPGKQTLEQLLNKLQKDLPTNIQVHTRTIQAWGNVGAHDHSDDLFKAGVEFSRDEAVAALNSLLVILQWYGDTHLEEGSLPSPPAGAASGPSKPAPVATTPARKSGGSGKAIGIAAALVVVAIAGAVALNLSGGENVESPKDPPKKADRSALDAAYGKAAQPLPPASCRTTDAALTGPIAEAMTLLAGGHIGGARDEDKKAQQALEPLVAGHEKAPELWGALARARLWAGAGTAKALEATNRATELCPKWSEPHNLKGNLHVKEKDLAAARAAYLRAAKLDPSYVVPRYNLGLLELKDGAIAEAIAAFDVVIAQDPEYAPAYAARGRARLVSDKTAEAITDLEMAVRKNPKDGASAMVLGQAHKAAGDDTKANVYFCQAKRLNVAAAAPLCAE